MKEIRFTPKQKEALASLGIADTEQLLHYYPYRYEKLNYLPYRQWQIDSQVIISGRVISRPKISYFQGRHSVIYFQMESEDNEFRISVFNRPWLKNLKLEQQITVIGRYEGSGKILALQVSNQPMEELLGIHPVYSLKDKITEKTFNKLMNQALVENAEEISDFVDEKYYGKYGYLPYYQALKQLHQPSNETMLAKALDTLKYDEFVRFNLLMLSRRKDNFPEDDKYQKLFNTDEVARFIKNLPFKLTDDQLQATREITIDLMAARQMSRLLQGDVGTGKTIVSFIAMYETVLAGQQAALMAPTEILTRQHYHNLCNIFANYPIKIGVLYSSQSAAERAEVLNGLADGSIQMVVGTHSLFQQDVEYHRLGLIITDEQHRFGVKQRAALAAKGNYCDILMMSATPIPRTLATTLYGDIDVSTITETPNKDKVIHTKLVKKNSFIPILDEIEEKLAQGNQMYVVCPSIEKSETSRNANEIYLNLKKYFNNRYSVDLLHGQLSAEQKTEVEQRFKNGEIDILVCTTVVEVGVDVKNANIMIIYNANRFGLSQLHQLRGRIGRGDREGYCYLLTDSDDEETLAKLQVIVDNTDGFKISYYDLQMRGPGDIMGFKQSGLPQFELGNVIDDNDILIRAKQDAAMMLKEISRYPKLLEYIETNRDNNIIRF